jgi:hypothetical protein
MSIIADALKRAQKRKEEEKAKQSAEQIPSSEEKKPLIEPKTIAIGAIALVVGLIAVFVLIRPKKVPPPPQPKTYKVKVPVPSAEPVKGEEFVAEKEIELPYLKIGGIMYEPDAESYAVINDKIVAIGDEIEGATVIDIEKEVVTLRLDNHEFEVRIK